LLLKLPGLQRLATNAQLQIKLILEVFFRFVSAEQVMFLGLAVLVYAPGLIPVFLLLLKAVCSLVLHAYSLILLIVLLRNSLSVTAHQVLSLSQAIDLRVRANFLEIHRILPLFQFLSLVTGNRLLLPQLLCIQLLALLLAQTKLLLVSVELLSLELHNLRPIVLFCLHFI